MEPATGALLAVLCSLLAITLQTTFKIRRIGSGPVGDVALLFLTAVIVMDSCFILTFAAGDTPAGNALRIATSLLQLWGAASQLHLVNIFIGHQRMRSQRLIATITYVPIIVLTVTIVLLDASNIVRASTIWEQGFPRANFGALMPVILLFGAFY
jgi:hypothetical protein